MHFENEKLDSVETDKEFEITLRGMLAQDESRNISENIKWGIQRKFEKGEIFTKYKNFMGYTCVDGEIVIVPEQAEVVRKIFDLYLQGLTLGQIKSSLESQRIKTVTGKDAWNAKTIRDMLKIEKYKGDTMLQKTFTEDFVTGRIARELEKDDVPNWNGKARWYEGSIRKMLSNEKYKGDALLQKTYTVDFLSKKRVINKGEVPKYYVEESHPAIIDKDTWEAVQFEMERKKAYTEKYNIQKLDYVTNDNPFAGRVICGCCGSTFGRKVWNSTDEILKRTIWQCNNKYRVKGKIGCRNRHINEKVLYQAFVYASNEIVKNIDYYMEKWEKQINSEDILERVTTKRFIDIFRGVNPIKRFDAGLYFKLVEKIIVYEDGVSMGLLDGTEVNWE